MRGGHTQTSAFRLQRTKSLTMLGHLRDGHALLVGHEAEDGEDDEAGVDAGAAVEEGDDEGVAVTVVGELVEAGHGDQPSRAGAQRVEDLRGRVAPHLDSGQGIWSVLARSPG